MVDPQTQSYWVVICSANMNDMEADQIFERKIFSFEIPHPPGEGSKLPDPVFLLVICFISAGAFVVASIGFRMRLRS